MTDPKLKIAVFIDFDNIEIGVKTTLGGQFDVGAVLEAIKERGEVVTKVAYSDWKRAGDQSRQLSQHAIRMVQRNLTPGGDKNGADINLALDALEMAFTHDHINAFVIVGGDSDFITLVEKLKQYDKKVFVVGGRQFTSLVMQKNCHEFLAYENLISSTRRTGSPAGRPKPGTPGGALDVDKAVPLVKRALKVLEDREVTPQLGLLKSTLLQLDSTFSERDYGAGTFRDFIDKVAERGVVTLRQSGRSVLVELVEDATSRDASETPSAAPEPAGEAATEAQPIESAAAPEQAVRPPGASRGRGERGSRHRGGEGVSRERAEGPPRERVESQPRDRMEGPPRDRGEGAAADRAEGGSTFPVPDTEQAAEAVATAARLFARAKQPPRWPMYVRQVRQFLRTVDEAFDERKFGFGGVLDFLRACQREGLLRLDRDRQGVLRVFAGPQLARPAAPPSPDEHEAGDVTAPMIDVPAVGDEVVEAEPVVVSEDAAVVDGEIEAVAETVEEGQAEEPEEAPRPRSTRKRAASGTKKTASKTATTRRAPRARKTKTVTH